MVQKCFSNLPAAEVDEQRHWQLPDAIQLKDHELVYFHHFVTVTSTWIDLFDPVQHFSVLVPHLAIHNEGLMNAILALGARHLLLQPLSSEDAHTHQAAAGHYYHEALEFLQSTLRFISYNKSREVLATILIMCQYEMINGAGEKYVPHLKAFFWIQRVRKINGESQGLEQASWWAWLRQDVWAAFRERRRCFSPFQPTKVYDAMDTWEMASRVIHLLAQAVNYSSDEEKEQGNSGLPSRIQNANTLLHALDEWHGSLSVHFEPLPPYELSSNAFCSIWIHPPALGISIQMFCTAKILLLIHQPAAGGYPECRERDRRIANCIDTIGGIALRLIDDACRVVSTQCLFVAGLYCGDEVRRSGIIDLIRDHHAHTYWPSNADLVAELRSEWARAAG